VRAEALYAPILVAGDELEPFLIEHETQEDIQIAMAQEYGQRQEEREVARREHHVIERAIFNWYRGLHPDSFASWWTQTPWGAASGGSGELLEIPDAPTGFAVELRMEPSPFMLISCDEYGEHTGFDILRAKTPAGVTKPPVMPEELFIKNTGLPLMDSEIVLGMKYWYQIRARNGDNVGEWTEIVSVEYK
jgi:hypothetical protein